MKRGKSQKQRKRMMGFAIGGMAAALCVGTIFVVQARRNVLNSTKPYTTGSGEFKILEIVPSHDAHENEEIGYFVSEEGIPASGDGRANFMDVSKAKSLGGRSEANTDVESDIYKEELQNLISMRNYGLIKYEGVDQGAYNIDVSEYPVYSKEANFIKNSAAGYIPMDTRYLRGAYVSNRRGNGAYFLKDDYELRDDGTIWHVIRTMVPDPTVSGNTVSGNTVSGNTVSENNLVEQITYEQVTDADETNKGLPEGVEIRYEADGSTRLYTGNLDFTANDGGRYYGLATTDYNVREKAETANGFHNGEWFKEYVLGDRTSSKKIKIDTRSASDITTSMLTDGTTNKYDLIYISGTYDAYEAAGTNLSEDVVKTLFNMATLPQYQAIIMDYALLGPSSGTNPTNIERLALMLWQIDQRAYLTDSSVTAAADKFVLDSDKRVTSIPAPSSNRWAVLGASMNGLTGIGDGTFVAGSVYVYNHKRDYFVGSKAQVDALDFFANGDFATSYTDEVIARGFGYVKAYVQMNNLNYPDERVAEEITPAMIIQYILAYDGSTPSLIKAALSILEIEPVRAFRYNMYCGSDEYENCDPKIQEKRMDFINRFLGDSFADNPGLVQFTSMTIEEFIGRNEDLNETYDMIYIGSEISHSLLNETKFKETNGGTRWYNNFTYYYTRNNGKTKDYSFSHGIAKMVDNNLTGYITEFTDFRLDGNVYYNIGDYFYAGSNGYNSGNKGYDSLLGIIEDDTEYTGDKNSQQSLARFSGRDLTEDKKNQMIDYLNTGYPVVVAGDIMCTITESGYYKKQINPTARIRVTTGSNTENGWDHGRVDNSSKLYEFLDYAINGQTVTNGDGTTTVVGGNMENLISEIDVINNITTKEVVSEFLNKPKLSLNLTNRPVEYSYTTKSVSGTSEPVIDQQSSLTPDTATGKYYLDYEFSITNAATLYTDTDTYGVHLYIDVNADGKFSESEELNDCIVTNAVTGDSVPFVASINGRIYSLQTNVLYKLRREVPDGFAGILPWSLEVVMNSNSSIRASEIGYSKVPRQAVTGSATAAKININILQVTRDGNASNLNLQSQLANPTGSNYFGIYLKNLADYNVTVTTIGQTQYENNHLTIPGYAEKMINDYDMLILGFGDCYNPFQYDQSVKAIIDFMNSGKPVLLTHDLIMFRTGDKQTKMLRNIAGMDRYGCTDDNHMVLRKVRNYTRSDNPDIMEEIENSGYRVVYMPGTEKKMTDYQTHGLTNLTMVRYRGNSSNTYSNDYGRRYINFADINSMGKANWNDQQSYTVHSINEGQITRYPYILPDSFTVAKTHNQYYQLNMEADLDEDGETDIVVWYTIGNQFNAYIDNTGGGARYWVTPNDVINNYYIYNKGNITYSGVGHSKPASQASEKYEAQLFVNTMIAAYRAGIKDPTVKMYEDGKPESQPISSLAIAYDKKIGKDASDTVAAKSSMLKDDAGNYINEFVDDGEHGTRAFFQISDSNFVKGTKSISAKFYVENPNGNVSGTTPITVDGQTIYVNEVSPTIYTSDFTSTVSASDLQSGVRYGFNLPMHYLESQGEIRLYIGATTTIKNVTVSNSIRTETSQEGFTLFTIRKMDLLSLD